MKQQKKSAEEAARELVINRLKKMGYKVENGLQHLQRPNGSIILDSDKSEKNFILR
ncbi:hypothetical protein [Paenibacillus planticolens]|uniref:hypothetical protein n=1 Tax=Paenibacillus planticolens TaxID=2654976 RepID=UPI001492BB0E|nr:hypothetical protein [Paenibacillus planticolens]